MDGKAQTYGDLLLQALEDLKKSEFRRFKDKLSDLRCGDTRAISRGPLEDADVIVTKNLMIKTYGEEGALDVAVQVFKVMSLMGPAEELQKKMSQEGTFCEKIGTRDAESEWRSQYMEFVRNEYQCIEENNARMRETVNLEKRYTNLLLIDGHQDEEDRKLGLLSIGRSHTDMMDTRTSSKYSSITIKALFDPNEDGVVPKTVVLVGPAGIGKTMTTQKIMLDWASGNVFGDRFDYVFHVSCRELNILTGIRNIAGLLAKTCKLRCPGDLALSILSHCQKVLFIFDGFDELRWSINDQTHVCDDPLEETNMETLLKSLLMKKILQEASLVITTRPFALDKLKTLVSRPRYVEVLGFTGQDRQEYFLRFFQNEEHAAKALDVIQENEIIYTMCAIPVICWIVCTVIKPNIKQGLRLTDYNTATSIYLLYLKGLIKYHGRKKTLTPCLKKMCALANEGVRNKKILFDKRDLERHGLKISEMESTFLNENIFCREIETRTFYSFIHLSVQEFFAALYYGFVEEANEDLFLPKICKGNSLLDQCRNHPHLTLAIRFLFGLSSVNRPNEMATTLGCHLRVTAAMEQWLTGNHQSRFCTEAIYCLFEMQDQDFTRRVLSQTPEIVFIHSWYWTNRSYKELAYCLAHCPGDSSLTIFNYKLDSAEQEEIFRLLIRFSKLCFSRCRFSQPEESSPEKPMSFLVRLSDPHSRIQVLRFDECLLRLPLSNDLQSLVRSQSLTKLYLTWRTLCGSSLKSLCEVLRHPSCSLQELSLMGCRLDSSSCEDLSSVIVSNQILRSLDLSCNFLKDSGVQVLCEGLRHPNCALQNLRLSNCELTSSCCRDLRSVFMTNRSLTNLDLSHNCLQDVGVKLLCEGLRHPECPLQELRLWGCDLESSCCEDLHSVMITNSALTKLEVSMYLCEELSESEVRDLCERLSRLACVSQKKKSELTLKYQKQRKQFTHDQD
ncbi:NACHT, LRR and PYD domains-containing protein 3 [Leptodactylus fuscus]